MILYHPFKFNFNTMNGLSIMGCGHFPPSLSPPRAQAPKESPGRIGLIQSVGSYLLLKTGKLVCADSVGRRHIKILGTTNVGCFDALQ